MYGVLVSRYKSLPNVHGLKLLHIPSTQLPELCSIGLRIVYCVDLQLGLWMGKEEFLAQGVVLVYVPGNLDFHVQLISINNVGHHVTKMRDVVYPGKWCSTKGHIWKLSGFLRNVINLWKP